MKVLFVSSGRYGKINPLVENQARSLTSAGLEIEFFLVESGITGHWHSIRNLKQKLRVHKYDIIHAHYSFSAFVATLACAKPLVVSLLGSDASKNVLLRSITTYLSNRLWAVTIVKTLDMKQKLNLKHAFVIPNGVDIDRFAPIPKKDARFQIGYGFDRKLVVFVANPKRKEKNYKLAIDSIRKANRRSGYEIELMTIYNTPNNDVPYFLNAADVLLLTSKREGSVNVVKEAMACNTPVVSTDVGDVSKNTSDVAGCYVVKGNSDFLADAIIKAIDDDNSAGRERIIELELDSKNVANRILNIYEQAKCK